MWIPQPKMSRKFQREGCASCRKSGIGPRASRIPFAAAQSGYFFRAFGRLHPTKDFPYISLIVLGAISIVAGFFSLGTVIDALIVTRILVQFMGQVFGLILLRRKAPDMPRPYKMWRSRIAGTSKPILIAFLRAC